MVGKVLKRIRNALDGVVDFVAQVSRTPKERSIPDPSVEAAKRVGDAMHVSCGPVGGGGGGSSGSSAADGLFGQVLADGHKKARGKTPSPRAR